ncbi:MAG TPA: glycoside hydrolase family 3 C-terminal domain-containing protein [Polyangia bacterium]
MSTDQSAAKSTFQSGKSNLVALTLTTLLAACSLRASTNRVTPTTVAEATSPAARPSRQQGQLLSPLDGQVEAWLSALTLEEKIGLVAGTGFDTVGVPRLNIPALRMTDGPVGVREGQSTAFAAGVLLAATFDPALAESVGAAIARETKGHGKNVILGPGVNIARTALNGRNFEYFGEDPELAARTTVAYIRGVQSQGVVATVKHFAANNQETDRMTVSAEVGARALHEIYLPAFEAAVKEAGVGAVMCAYNRIGGIYACEHPDLLSHTLRGEWGFRGLVMSDWGATHSVAPAIRAGLDLEMPKGDFFAPARIRAALDQKAIEPAHLDEMVRRQLRTIAALPLDSDSTLHPEAIDTSFHRAINREVARSGFVLLKNHAGTLPLDRTKLRRIAVVGPRGGLVDGGGGSAHVSATHKVTLVDALRAALGNKVRVDFAPGEITPDGLAPIPTSALTPPAGHAGHGLLGEYFAGTEREGTPRLVRVDANIDFHWEIAPPAPGLPEDKFSIRWTGKLTPPTSGLYALALRSDDGSRLYIDGKVLVDDWGDHPPTLKMAEIHLVGGKAYDIRLDFFEGILGASVELLWQRADKDPMRRVAEIARGADVVIAAVGDGMGDETEGSDRTTLALPGRQDAIVRAAAAVNPKLVVITTTGAAVAMPWLDQAQAVLHAWFPGQEAGAALTDVLLGEVSPSGKLPVSFPKRVEDEPAFGNFPGTAGKVAYQDDVLVGYRWYDTRRIEPLFPFGHGLSYTTFAYRDMSVSPWDPKTGVSVRLKVKNTGKSQGAEVVQIYVHADTAAVLRPEQELRAFAKLNLSPGEEREVSLKLPPRAFAYFDAKAAPQESWRIDAVRYEIRAASSSRDIRQRASVVVP